MQALICKVDSIYKTVEVAVPWFSHEMSLDWKKFNSSLGKLIMAINL